MTNRFEQITRAATKPAAAWSNHDLVCFHYFNPNGLAAQKKAVDALIDAAVDAGKCKSGAIIAHGSLDYFYTDKLAALYNQKRVNRIDLAVTLQGLRRSIESAREFLAAL